MALNFDPKCLDALNINEFNGFQTFNLLFNFFFF